MSMQISNSTLYKFISCNTHSKDKKDKNKGKNMKTALHRMNQGKFMCKSTISYNPSRDLAKISSAVTVGQAEAVAQDIQMAMRKIKASGADPQDIKEVLARMGKAAAKARAKVRRIAKKDQMVNMKKAAERKNDIKRARELEEKIKRKKRSLYAPEVNDISSYYGKDYHNDDYYDNNIMNTTDIPSDTVAAESVPAPVAAAPVEGAVDVAVSIDVQV